MRRLALIAVLLACLPAGIAAARQFVQEGTLRVAFDAKLTPHSLPRERNAPVTVHMAGAVRTTDGSTPPQLRDISIAMNRAGVVSVVGLPSCQASELQQTSTEAALALCRDALVGRGHFAANVNFSGVPVFPARGPVLIFNSSTKKRAGLLLHLYGSSPVRAAFVLPFKISRNEKGKFGTVFSTHIPRLASDRGYVTDIGLTIGREYRYRGEPRSFISASCAAPAGFTGAFYELAKATFSFADGKRLVSRLPGDCKVR
jgi:hypothetical protein